MCPSQRLYVEALTLSITVLGKRDFKEVLILNERPTLVVQLVANCSDVNHMAD